MNDKNDVNDVSPTVRKWEKNILIAEFLINPVYC